MPLYDYRCADCGRELEVIQKYEDGPPEETEICSASPENQQAPCRLERMMPGSATFVWPGDYSNDGRGGWKQQGMAMTRLEMHNTSGPKRQVFDRASRS